MTLPIDSTSEFGQRIERRLDTEQVVWLTTVSQSGKPQPSMVWFLRDGDDVLVMSQPKTAKVKAIAANPNDALNFNGTEQGGDMVVMNGTAILEEPYSFENVPAAYLEKYRNGITGIDMTPETFIAEYSQPIRIRIARIRGF
jgi:PPOX class probable F420-dependent enzyme